MVRDFIGNLINVGDRVFYVTVGRWACRYYAEVVDIGPRKITLRSIHHDHPIGRSTVHCLPESCIRAHEPSKDTVLECPKCGREAFFCTDCGLEGEPVPAE